MNQIPNEIFYIETNIKTKIPLKMLGAQAESI